MASKIDLATVMDAIAAALVSGGTVTKAYGWPHPTVQKGQAVVGYPEDGALGVTFQRGLDTATFPVWIIAGLPGEKSTRDYVSTLIGASDDVKTVIETALPQVAVERFRPETYETTGGAFMAVRFDCDVLS
jgi:hypothetical protein